MEAHLYARWSSREQKHGNTIPRQREIATQCAEAKGWRIASSFYDDGMSAWTGSNIRKGKLAEFINGFGADGGHEKVLVVEQLDRLTRRPPMDVLMWMQRVTATGLAIYTANDGMIITQDRLREEPFAIMQIVMNAFRGFSESQTKHERGTDNWQRKRDAAVHGEAMTSRAPAWLRVVRQGKKRRFEVIEPRGKVVERIFHLALAGKGKVAIARLLNEEGVPPFGPSKVGWQDSYIKKILATEAVVGRYQPHRKSRNDERRTPVGDPIDGYFPAVVNEAMFAQVQNKRPQTTYAAGRRFANLWSGIAHCEECGGAMNFRTRGTSRRASGRIVRDDYLICRAATLKRCESYVYFNYTKLTDNIFDIMLHLALDDRYFEQGEAGQLENELAVVERAIRVTTARAKSLLRLLNEDEDDSLIEDEYRALRLRLKSLKEEQRKLRARLDELKRAETPDLHYQRVAEMRRLIDSDDSDVRDEARATIKAALDELVEVFAFSGNGRAVLRLRGGVRHILVRKDGTIDADVPVFREHSTERDSVPVQHYFRRQSSRS